MVIHNLSNSGSQDRLPAVAMQALKCLKEMEKERIKRELFLVNQRIREEVNVLKLAANRRDADIITILVCLFLRLFILSDIHNKIC